MIFFNIVFFFSHYLSTPQLSFDCFLKSTKVELELLTDIDKILFIEQNLRGGMSYISQRYCKAGKQTSTIGNASFFTELLFIDANNLYGK
jgi:hypothetical protein